jgi:hypothetical protein
MREPTLAPGLAGESAGEQLCDACRRELEAAREDSDEHEGNPFLALALVGTGLLAITVLGIFVVKLAHLVMR